MPLDAFLLILIAGLIHAGWNRAAKHSCGESRFAFCSAALVAVVWAAVGGGCTRWRAAADRC